MSLDPGGTHYTPPTSLKPSKYAFMSMFLLRVLNLDDEMLIVRTSRVAREKIGQGKLPTEILPRLSIPATLWLQDEIVLPDATIKAALLREINVLLSKSLQTLQSDEMFLLDDNTLLYYEKLSNAYDFLKFDRAPSSFDAFREDDEYEDFDIDPEPVSMYPTSSGSVSGRGSASEFNRHSSTSRSVSSGSYKSRISSVSRDFRKLSFLGLNGQSHSSMEEGPDSTPPSPISPQSAPQRSASLPNNSAHNPHNPHRDSLNALLSKSKFYNKLRRRDSAASCSSALSTPTSLSSNVSTGSGRRKSSQAYLEQKRQKERMTDAQKQENQRAKLEYYVQVRELAKNLKFLAGFLGRPGSRASLVRLMEFVKNNVFRLVLIDISAMTVEYAHLKALRVI